MIQSKEVLEGIEFYKIKHDGNGNPRYVFHFLNLAKDYETAIKIANKELGGKKFHNKTFGGGIVLSSYNLQDTAKEINKLYKEQNK